MVTFVRGGLRVTMAKEDSMNNFLLLEQEMYVNIKLVMSKIRHSICRQENPLPSDIEM